MLKPYDWLTRRALDLANPYDNGTGAPPAARVWPYLRSHLRPLRLVLSVIVTVLTASIEVWLIRYAGPLIEMLSDTAPADIWQIHRNSQQAALLNRSVRDNIAIGQVGVGRDQIETAAREARAHDFICDLRDSQGRTGYDANVGERGVKLSGGQRQRIALARVILKGAPILILDESTSGLDSKVEAEIQTALTRVMRDKTVIALAHRLSTIASMDRFIVIDPGQIVESGTHRDLRAAGKLYAVLWKCQSGGFIGD